MGEDNREHSAENRVRRAQVDALLPIAERAAQHAVHETFRLFGVDTNDQNSINAFRSTLVFSHNLRKTSEKAWYTTVGVIVAAAVGFALHAATNGFKGWPHSG